MEIVNKTVLEAAKKKYSDARKAIDVWVRLMKEHSFSRIQDVQKIFPSADAVGPDKIYICFDIRGNRYRLICQLEYEADIALVHEFLTHADYSYKYPH